MVHVTMIALPIVLPHQLPVPLFDNPALMGYFCILQIIRLQIRPKCISDRAKVGWRVSNTYKHVALDHFHRDRSQPVCILVEFVVHVSSESKVASVDFIRPFVILTDESLIYIVDLASRAITDLEPSMPAYIMKGSDHVVLASHDQYRVIANLSSHPASRIWYLKIKARVLPLPMKDELDVSAVGGMVVEELSG